MGGARGAVRLRAMGYQDTPLPFACLACGWASVLVQILRFNGRSHFCLARPAAKVLSAARLLFLCIRLSFGDWYSVPLLEAALTTAPYAAAWACCSLIIAPLCEAQNAPNAFFMTNEPQRWQHFSARTSATLLKSNFILSGGFYVLFALVLTTEEPTARSELARAGTIWLVSCFLLLAAAMGWAMGQASHAACVTCYGVAVTVRSVLALFCGCLCVQAYLTSLASHQPRWFSRNFALAQGLYLAAELLPVAVLSAAGPAVDARAAAERPRGAGGLRAALVRVRLRRRLFWEQPPESGAPPPPPPLAQAALCSLEPTWLAADADDSCSICLDGMCKGEETLQLSCQHTFHAACLRPWLARSGSCPLCKQVVAESCATPTDNERGHTQAVRSGDVLLGLATLLVVCVVLVAPPATLQLAADW